MSMAQFAPQRIVEQHFLPYPEGSYCLRGSGDVITNGYIPSSPPYAPNISSLEQSSFGSQSPSEDTDTPCSPGLVRTYSYDKAVFDFRRIPPEKIAAQITLLDLPLFKAVTPEELRSCGWTKKDKKEKTPNVVGFTQRFNHTSYWVMDEVLNEESPKVRAEIISQFIRVAKKLYDLNNLHSLKAVIAGLQSVPIYRLSQTWRHVNKKDMSTYSKMVEFLSQEDNWKRLRYHMAADKLPCIPYLGLFLTDLCFTYEIPSKRGQFDTICNTIAYFQNSTYDELVPESHIQGFLTRTFFIDELQRVFEDDKYRLSLKYEPISDAEPAPPTGGPLRLSKSLEDLLGPFDQPQDELCEAKPLTPVVAILQHRHSYHNIRDRRNTLSVTATTAVAGTSNHLASSPSLSSHSKSPFKVSKSSKAGSSHVAVQLTVSGPSFDDDFNNSPQAKKGSTLPKDLRMEPPTFHHSGPGYSKGSRTQSESEEKARKSNPKSLKPWKIRHRKAHSLGGNALSSLGVQRLSPTHSSGEPQLSTGSLSRSLIDDDEAFSSAASSFTPNGSTGNLSTNSALSSGCSADSSEVVLLDNDHSFRGSDSAGTPWCSFEDEEEGDELAEEHLAAMSLMEGELKRKLLKRAGKNVSQLKHRNRTCWVQLNHEYLLLLGSRPHRKSNKAVKLKGFISRLKDCRVKYKDPSEKMNDKQFILVDDDGGHIRFEAKTAGKAMAWVESIRQAIHREEERERQRVNQSLIQFDS